MFVSGFERSPVDPLKTSRGGLFRFSDRSVSHFSDYTLEESPRETHFLCISELLALLANLVSMDLWSASQNKQ